MFYKPLKYLMRGLGHLPACTSSDKYFCGLALVLMTPAAIHIARIGSKLSESMENSLYLLSLICYILASVGFIFYSYVSRESYKKILNDMTIVNSELNTETIWRQTMMITTLFLVLMTKFAVGFSFQLETTVAISNIVLDLAFTCPLLHHVVLVDLLASKFSALNRRLENLATDVDTKSLHIVSAKINSVFRLHTQLHVLVWDINSYFCLYNLLSVTTRISFTVFNMYVFLKSISEGGPFPNLSVLIFMLVDVAMFVAQCEFCYACAKEANRTALIAHQLLQPETSVQIWEEVALFSRLSLKHVHFSVGGVFFLDRPLITKVAMTALSYLIIAVQLKDVKPSADVGAIYNGTGIASPS
ncbi:hypothetical protein J6590_031939 [Homalodisca vitripennis]|nr:hypothetical protein J6590_103179 [Homalodisca vitripennis]KAG8282682.1 hypothetical protein J6590_031939 [Homalodisca vitripennis]